jgi:hypothetical protein
MDQGFHSLSRLVTPGSEDLNQAYRGGRRGWGGTPGACEGVGRLAHIISNTQIFLYFFPGDCTEQAVDTKIQPG